MSTLSFAGVPFCLDTPDYYQWQYATHPLADTQILDKPQSVAGNGIIGLAPLPDHPRPVLRLNEWFYPSGATNWSEFQGLMTSSQLEEVTDYLEANSAYPSGGNYGSATLTVAQGAVTVSSTMYLLPPRPLTQNGEDDLYLVTLVDERFFWTNQPAGTMPTPSSSSWDASATPLSLDDSTTWSDLISDLATALGFSLSLSISSNYGQPHPQSDFATPYQSAAVLLDQALANVGRSLVRNLDGDYTAPLYQSNATTIATNKANNQAIGGGDFISEETSFFEFILPRYFSVVFRKVSAGAYTNSQLLHLPFPRIEGDTYTLTADLAHMNLSSISPPYTPTGYLGYKTFLTSAEYDTTNLTACTSLANQLALDYVQWQYNGIDITYANIADWTPEGINDITWKYTNDRCQTRIQRKPYNTSTESFQHHLVPITVNPFASASGITVEDISTAVYPTTDLVFDSSSGLVVSAPGGTTADVTLTPATIAQAGGVSTSGQTIGGVKTFADYTIFGQSGGSGQTSISQTVGAYATQDQLLTTSYNPGSSDAYYCGWVAVSYDGAGNLYTANLYLDTQDACLVFNGSKGATGSSGNTFVGGICTALGTNFDSLSVGSSDTIAFDTKGRIATAASSVPTVVSYVGSGSSASINGSDTNGTVTLTTASTVGAGTQAEITFSSAYGSVPKTVLITPANSATALLTTDYAQVVTASLWLIALGSGTLSISTTYVWHYLVIA